MTNRDPDILLQEMDPDIYSRNAFRVLRLSTESSPRQIKRQFERIRLKAKLQPPRGTGGKLQPLVPERNIQAEPKRGNLESLNVFPKASPQNARDAMQRLNDPERRLIDEFFWFWPETPGSSQLDDALLALEAEDTERAEMLWRSREGQAGQSGVSAHNLAVLNHMAALEIDALDRPNTEDNADKAERFWREAYNRWRYVLKQESVWERLSMRVEELDDPRLSSRLVEKIRSTLPTAILLINAKLVMRLGEQGNGDAAGWYANLLNSSQFEPEYIERARKLGVEDFRLRLKTALKFCDEETRQDPVRANEAAASLLDNTSLALGLSAVDRLFPEGHPTRVHMHDEFGLQILSSLIAYGNKTEEWATVTKQLERALQVVEGDAAKSRLRDNLERARANAKDDYRWKVSGFYELPAKLREKLEEAKELADLREYDRSISILEALREEHDQSGHSHAVTKPLAVCLNLRAMSRLEHAFRYLGNRYTPLPEFRKQEIRQALRSAGEDLSRALTLDPSNQVIRDNYDKVKGIASSASVRIPAPLTASSQQAPSAPSPSRPRPSQPARPKQRKSNWTPILVVAAIIGGIWFCSWLSNQSDSGSSAAGRASPTSTPRPRRTPTRRPNPTATSMLDGQQLAGECLRWNRVRDSHIGQNLCVYGTVVNVKPGDGVYTIEFSQEWAQFKVQDYNHYWLDIAPGECLEVHGTVRDNGSFLIITPDRDDPEIYELSNRTYCDR